MGGGARCRQLSVGPQSRARLSDFKSRMAFGNSWKLRLFSPSLAGNTSTTVLSLSSHISALVGTWEAREGCCNRGGSGRWDITRLTLRHCCYEWFTRVWHICGEEVSSSRRSSRQAPALWPLRRSESRWAQRSSPSLPPPAPSLI